MIKTFESWKNNIIDDELFSSGRAKYDPKVINGVIHYKTGNVEPYYFATITRKGDKFICKIYKRKKSGEKIRIRNKIKPAIEPDDLKVAHNYVREFLNQKLKKDKKRKNKEKSEDVFKKTTSPEVQKRFFEPPIIQQPMEEPTSRAAIRRF